MTSSYESRIDRQIREAAERGDFDNLPGSGKPLPPGGDEFDEEWWIRDLAKRESLAAALPPALALRREVEDLPATVAKKSSEAAVREIVADLNDRILRARRGPVEGPPVAMGTVDPDKIVAIWRDARGQSRS
jgi:hypothetical protein